MPEIINEIPSKIIEDIIRRNAVFICGAGMSGSRFPTSKALKEELNLKFLKYKNEEILERDLSEIAQEIYIDHHSRVPLDDYIADTFNNNEIKFQETHQYLAKLFCNIITTNYDHLIEDAFKENNKNISVSIYDGKKGKIVYTKNKAEIELLKIHGCSREKSSCVITEWDYYRWMLNAAELIEYIKNFIRRKTIILLGHSLSDRNLRMTFTKLKNDLGEDFPPTYAVLDKVDQNKYYIKILNYLNITIINLKVEDFLKNITDQISIVPSTQLMSHKNFVSEVRELLKTVDYEIFRNIDFEKGSRFWVNKEKGNKIIIKYLFVCFSSLPEKKDITALKNLINVNSEKLIVILHPQIQDKTNEISSFNSEVVKIYSLPEFYHYILELDKYITKVKEMVEKKEILKHYVDLSYHISDNLEFLNHSQKTKISSFINRWLNDDNRKYFALLGEFGSGKTWACEYSTYKLLELFLSNQLFRLPILIRLKDFKKKKTIQGLIEYTFKEYYEDTPRGGYEVFKHLNKYGRIVILFDGFDEIAVEIDRRIMLNNFEEIFKVLEPNSKVILTCRTHFFENLLSEQNLFHGEKIKFEIINLVDFDDDQINEVFNKLKGEYIKINSGRIQSIYDLKDLIKRPIILKMILETLSQITEIENINPAIIYMKYIRNWLDKDEDQSLLKFDDKFCFMKKLAWELFEDENKKEDIYYKEIPEKIEKYLSIKSKDQIDYIDNEIRTASFLVLDFHGNLSFAHKSFMEFFVAYHLIELLQKNEAPPSLINNEIRLFIYYLLTIHDSYSNIISNNELIQILPEKIRKEFRIVEEKLFHHKDDSEMIFVLKGQFIYGDLRSETTTRKRIISIETIQNDFLIDKYPITNKQYVKFLNDEKLSNEKWLNKNWLDLKSEEKNEKCRIEIESTTPVLKFKVDNEYADHPVIFVSLEGAKQYAKWAGKELPDHKSWEKASRGIDGRMYPWGERFNIDYCNLYRGKINNIESVYNRRENHSPYGCCGQIGNVMEWVSESETESIVRGSSYFQHEVRAFCSATSKVINKNGSSQIGFRTMIILK